jgi:hypothetical protein
VLDDGTAVVSKLGARMILGRKIVEYDIQSVSNNAYLGLLVEFMAFGMGEMFGVATPHGCIVR